MSSGYSTGSVQSTLLTILFAILVPKLGVSTRKIDFTPIDEGHLDVRHQLEWISRRDDECSGFPGIDGSQPVALSDDLGGIERDRSQGDFPRKTMSGCRRGVMWKVSNMSWTIPRCDTECDARFMQASRQFMG